MPQLDRYPAGLQNKGPHRRPPFAQPAGDQPQRRTLSPARPDLLLLLDQQSPRSHPPPPPPTNPSVRKRWNHPLRPASFSDSCQWSGESLAVRQLGRALAPEADLSRQSPPDSRPAHLGAPPLAVEADSVLGRLPLARLSWLARGGGVKSQVSWLGPARALYYPPQRLGA
jgi:hypothetical protein